MGEFYSYETLKKLIKYDTNKHKNLQTVLKYLNGSNQWSYTDWTPYYSNNYEECLHNEKCDELKKSLIYNQCIENADYTHYHCSCSETILYPNMFRNNNNNNTIVIGSKCYRKFGDEANKIMDDYEGKIKCFSCKKTVNKKIVDKYKHEKNIYHKKCYNGQNKCNISQFFPESPIIPESPIVPELPIILEPLIILEQPSYDPPEYEQPKITNITIIKFGRFKGKLVSELIEDQSYVKYMLSQDNSSGQFKDICDFIKKSLYQ